MTHGGTFALPGLEDESVRFDDIILTPRNVAKEIIQKFNPSGSVLDPCRGDGAFADHIPNCEWCEIRDGKDFYAWSQKVDWIISNPPYSIFSDFLRHSMTLAKDIVYLIPVNKIFNSDKMMREIWEWGGVKEILVIGGGASLGFPIGFCIGAVHFQHQYKGEIKVSFLPK